MGNVIIKIVKILLITLLILTVIYLLLKLIEWLRDNKGTIYARIRQLKEETAALIRERKKIVIKMMRLELMARLTLLILKVIVVSAGYFLWVYLINTYKYDPFAAFVTASGTIGIAYSIMVCILNKKIYTVSELTELSQRAVTSYYFTVCRVNPARLIEIDEEIVLKRKEELLLKRNLRS
jgi:hypothetical protein